MTEIDDIKVMWNGAPLSERFAAVSVKREGMYNRAVRKLYRKLTKQEQRFLSTEFREEVEQEPFYGEHLLVRFFYREMLDPTHYVLCGFLDVYNYGGRLYTQVAVNPDYRRRRVGSDLVKAAVSVVTEDLGKDLVYNVNVLNKPSTELVRALGGQFETNWEGDVGELLARYRFPAKGE